METWTISSECEEMETKAPNSQDDFSSQNYRRHKLGLVPSLLKSLFWEKTPEVMGNNSH